VQKVVANMQSVQYRHAMAILDGVIWVFLTGTVTPSDVTPFVGGDVVPLWGGDVVPPSVGP
jgi:hypothetical protein